MKAKYVLIALLWFAAIPIQAQVSSPVTFGIKAGMNYSTLIKDTRNLSADYRLGYVGGPFVRFNLSSFYVQPEVLFSSKNTYIRSTATTDVNNPGNPVNLSTTVQVNSIDVPLKLGVKVVNTDQLNVRVMGGPLASIVLGANGLEGILGSETPVRDAYTKAVWGYQVGAGVDVGSITFDALFEGGFNHAYDLTRYNLGKPKVGLFQFTVGYKFL
jgi:hypothetical protein